MKLSGSSFSLNSMNNTRRTASRRSTGTLFQIAVLFILAIGVIWSLLQGETLCKLGIEKFISVEMSCSANRSAIGSHALTFIDPAALPAGHTQQSQLPQRAGCACRDGSLYSYPGAPISGKAGHLLTFYIDASPMCYGQTIREVKTIVMWPDGTADVIPAMWGKVTASIKKPGDYTVNLQAQALCEDHGPANCSQSCIQTSITSLSISE
jgi:hypothetical protein